MTPPNNFEGQLTALASVRRTAAHAAESARIAASLPQRFDPPLPARCYHSTCIEAQFGLRSVGEVMTLRGTLARATFRPPRFPQQDPLPKQTEAMRQSKAEAMRQSKVRHVDLPASTPRGHAAIFTTERLPDMFTEAPDLATFTRFRKQLMHSHAIPTVTR